MNLFNHTYLKKKTIILLIILLLIIYLIYLIYTIHPIEFFSGGKIPIDNHVGDMNDKRWISLYEPQNKIFTGNEDKYWKNFPKGYNTDFPQDIPPPLQESQLSLMQPHGDNSYRKGLIDYNKLTSIINDKGTIEELGEWNELLLVPTTKDTLKYKYELQFEYDMLNRRTWIDRWDEYNPIKKMHYDYSEIKSPIEDINIINTEFKKRCYDAQQTILNKKQLIYFGIIPFDIYKYSIEKIEYLTEPNQESINKLLNIEIESFQLSDEEKKKNKLIKQKWKTEEIQQKNKYNSTPKLYSIKIMLFRESDLYLPTLNYQGVILNDKVFIFNATYIGGKAQDRYLMAEAYQKEPTYEIINKNYTNQTNEKILELNPDNVVKQVKDHQESYKINNQYACFNTDPDIYTNPKKSADILITSFFSDKNNYVPTRENCESSYDWFGRPKQPGILDTPCKKDDDCPFFESNENYPNKRGKCLPTGQCELPIGTKPLGFRFFSPSSEFRPLCYNCKSSEWNLISPLEDCCEEQFDKKKYPFLTGPDYSFKDDYQDRYNHFLEKKCYRDSNGQLKCE